MTSTTLLGLQVKLPEACRCTSDVAIIGAGTDEHYASLKCVGCGELRNWLIEFTARWIESVAGKFGAPSVITIRSSAIAKACANQDEYLKRKYDPTGKSWHDIITESFDELAPSPSGTGEERDSPPVPKISHRKEKTMTDIQTNETATTETANLPAVAESAIAAIDNYLAEQDPQTTIGKLIKFAKGEYLKGQDAEVVPLGSLFVVACDMTLSGFVRWEDGKPAEHKLIRVTSGDRPYQRQDLGFLDKEQWPKDTDGEPKDPWQPVIYVPIMDSDGEIATFTTGTVTGTKSYFRLLRRKCDACQASPRILSTGEAGNVVLRAQGQTNRESPTLAGGFYNAVTDEAAIRALYEKAPGPLIGVPSGHRFVVIDPDLQHRAARHWWKANKDRLSATRRHRTMSGGWHILFRPHPDFRHGTTVAQNVDTRAAGGYVIWWPAEGYEIVNPGALADVPDWILAAMPPAEQALTPCKGTPAATAPPSTTRRRPLHLPSRKTSFRTKSRSEVIGRTGQSGPATFSRPAQMNDTLRKAIRLGQQGIPVFFCSFSKRPTLAGGFYNAVTDEAAIRALYEKAPGPLIGVPSGHRFVVIDPDLQHRAARHWWKANKDRLSATRRHRTMSGGWHILFRPHPDFRHGTTVAQNVDTRAAGGYVIWWPAEGYEIVNPGALADVPDWILRGDAASGTSPYTV